MKLFLRLVTVLFAVVAIWVEGGRTVGAAESETAQSSLNDGYSLFYDFCNQESQLSILLWIKTTPQDISDYAKRVTSTAKDDMAILTKFGVSDSSLRLNKVSLPSFEIDVRKSMAVDRRQQLVWDNSGAAFAHAMSMTQAEVTNYGMHVAKILAENETDRVRGAAMRQIYEKWSALHDEAYKLSR